MTRKIQQIIDQEQNTVIQKVKAMTTRQLLIFLAQNDWYIPIDFPHTRQELEDRACEIIFDKLGL